MEKGITAVVVDDNKDTVKFFSEFLEIKGIAVAACGYSGKDALDLYTSLRPDIIFMDVAMPDYDGFYGLEEIKKADGNAKVVMVTADITSRTYERLQDLQASAIIFKPFNMDKVMSIVRELWSQNNIQEMLVQTS